MNHNKTISYIRASARSVGLTFKTTGGRWSGLPLFALYNRKTGENVLDNYLLDSAFNDACSGYIESWNGSTFDGIDLGKWEEENGH